MNVCNPNVRNREGAEIQIQMTLISRQLGCMILSENRTIFASLDRFGTLGSYIFDIKWSRLVKNVWIREVEFDIGIQVEPKKNV